MPKKKSAPKKSAAKKTTRKVAKKANTSSLFTSRLNFLLLTLFCVLVGLFFISIYQ